MGNVQWGRGLMADEARDATFLLTGAGMWVGKLAYLATDPMTIQEGKRAIAQAILDHWVKVRGPRYPHVNPLAQQPFGFNPPRSSPQEDASGDCGSNYLPSSIGPLEARNVIGIGGTKGLNHLCSLQLPQTVHLKAIGVRYWWLHWCHLGLTGWTDSDVSDKVDGIKMREPTWR